MIILDIPQVRKPLHPPQKNIIRTTFRPNLTSPTSPLFHPATEFRDPNGRRRHQFGRLFLPHRHVLFHRDFRQMPQRATAGVPVNAQDQLILFSPLLEDQLDQRWWNFPWNFPRIQTNYLFFDVTWLVCTHCCAVDHHLPCLGPTFLSSDFFGFFFAKTSHVKREICINSSNTPTSYLSKNTYLTWIYLDHLESTYPSYPQMAHNPPIPLLQFLFGKAGNGNHREHLPWFTTDGVKSPDFQSIHGFLPLNRCILVVLLLKTSMFSRVVSGIQILGCSKL